MKNMVILLDRGHAKTTPGKRSPKFENGSQLFEWEFNSDVVKRISKKLDELGITNHIITTDEETLTYDVGLSNRVKRINAYCDKYGAGNCILISVHSNAFGDGKSFNTAKGWSVYTTKGVTKSDAIATEVWNVANEILPQYGFTTRKDMKDGDVDYEENFTVIYGARCPAILTENLFFTNRKECEFLRSDIGRDVITDIHVEAIKRIVE